MDLDCMKYAELRRLAKEAGLKANMKADKLREAIKQHYQQQQQQCEQGTGVNGDMAPHVEDSSLKKVDPQVPSTSLFVTKRRGKASKRKYSEEVDPESKPLETDEKDSDSHSGAQATSAKQRRVSSTQQPDTQLEKPDTHTVPLPATCNTAEEPKVMKAGKIPRHQALLNRTKPMLKPTTPNFKKLHEAHFNKMESIDSYVQRKTKQMDVFKNSVKELKMLSDKTISKPAEGNAQRKSSRASLFSPAPVDKKLSSARLSQLNKPALKDSVPFRPSILSTRRINVRFSQVVPDKEQKKAMVKTPARLSPSTDLITPGQDLKVKGKPEIKASGLSSTRTPGSTFVFNGNTSISNTPGTNKKSTFDLKASLSRPLSYKPHKGKLKAFGPTQETSVAIPSNQKNYKQHKVQTREDRRTKQNEDRKQKKENMLGARRGLTMS